VPTFAQKPVHPFSDMRHVALPLFNEDILYHKSRVAEDQPVCIVYDSKHFYAVSMHQAKGFKMHTTPAVEGDRVTLTIGMLQKILKSLKDNSAEIIAFKKGQMCLVNQVTFDKITERAMAAAGITLKAESEDPIEGRKG